MNLIINFRDPDPFVELDGVRKPLSDFPNLRVTRTGGVDIPGLREVNFLTGWVTVGPPAVYSPWWSNPQTPEGPEWEETITNLRVEGVLDSPIIITGADKRLRMWQRPSKAPPVVKTSAPAPKAQPPAKPKPVEAEDAAEARRRIIAGLPAPKPAATVEPEDWLDMMEAL